MKDIYEMACDLVNPDGGELNENQENEVQALVGFAESVLKELCPTKRALDLALPPAKDNVYRIEWLDGDTVRLTPSQ